MILINKLLNPKIDYVFKRIFGYTGNEEITKAFISSIISKNIKEITLNCNPITEKDLLDDKIGILDIKAKLNNNVNCNIELQVVDNKNIEKRILFYWSKMYCQNIKLGKDYENLEKSIVILLTDYNLDSLKELEECVTKWNIREKKHSEIVLTDVMEIYIIELKKFKRNIYDELGNLSKWIQFINNPEVITEMEDKEIKNARKVLEEISQDERERRLTELREKYIMDQKAIHDHGYDKGLEKGIEQGIKQGIQQGAVQNQKEIAQKMKFKGFDKKTISEITGLTEEQIKNL